MNQLVHTSGSGVPASPRRECSTKPCTTGNKFLFRAGEVGRGGGRKFNSERGSEPGRKHPRRIHFPALRCSKSDCGLCPVINLKALNRSIKDEHFKMEGFHMIRDIVKQGNWMVKVDSKDAYFFISVHRTHQKFLRFQWKGQTYQFHCLPFSMSCAPQVFTKVLKPVVAF